MRAPWLHPPPSYKPRAPSLPRSREHTLWVKHLQRQRLAAPGPTLPCLTPGKFAGSREGRKDFALFAFHQGSCSFFCCCQPLICLKCALVKLRTDQTETNICANYSFWKIGNNGPKGINTPTVNHRKPMREKAVWALKRTVQMSSGNRTARGINFPTNEQCTRRPAADGSDSLLFCVLF